MKTIDTAKLWTVHPATDTTHPEICGPGGINMDVYDATTEQAQEIADVLNKATEQGAYSVTARVGAYVITYSAPAADEVMWMYRQAEKRGEHATPNPVVDESTNFYFYSGGRQGGKSTSALAYAVARIAELTQKLQDREAQLVEQVHAVRRFSDGEAYYGEQLDRCGRALGREAFIADNGSVSDMPLRAKIAELVERMSSDVAAERAAQKDMLDRAERRLEVTAARRDELQRLVNENEHWKMWAQEYRALIDAALSHLPRSVRHSELSMDEQRQNLPHWTKILSVGNAVSTTLDRCEDLQQELNRRTQQLDIQAKAIKWYREKLAGKIAV